jgi:hypothetical protein
MSDDPPKQAKTFRDLEPDINDLVRWADLTLSVCEDEVLEGIKITEGGAATVVALRHLVDLTRKLKQDYYEAYRA